RFVDLGTLFPHRARVINHNAQRDWNVFVTKRFYDLLLAILAYGEGILVEVGDHALLVVDDGGVQQHLLHVGMENEPSGFGRRLLLRFFVLTRPRRFRLTLAWRW